MFQTKENYLHNTHVYLKQYLLPQTLFESSSLLRQKLNNFLLLKSDIEIDLKVNATPFQQGALLIAYFPRSLNTSCFRGEASEFLASITSAPHRILYLEQANSTSFTVPYANIVDWINLTDSNNTFGTINIYALSPLSGMTAIDNVDVTVRMRLVNPVVEVPTDNSILSTQYYRDKEIIHLQKKSSRRGPVGLMAQANEGGKEGPITKISSGIATIAGALSSVPLIGPAALIVSWFARGISGVAATLGWSKPLDLTMPHAIYNKPAAHMGYTEGKDASHTLAQIADNGIDSTNMNPSTVDELHLKQIFKRPNMVGRITIQKNDFTQGRALFSWEVSPFNYLTQSIASGGNDFALGSFSFTSMMAKYWRGSINYTLSAVKTPYHAARLMAVYFPNRLRLDTPDTFEEAMTTNSNMIYDLTAKSDTEFSLMKPILIPYTSEEPWKQTLYVDNAGDARSDTTRTSVGTVVVYCLNELVCPETVSQEVTFLLQVQAGDDYELALPQIQLQGGFANPLNINVAPMLISALNTEFNHDLSSTVFTTGDFPDWQNAVTEDVEVSQDHSTWAEFETMVGVDFIVPDGMYEGSLYATFAGEHVFDDGTNNYILTVLDSKITKLTMDHFVAQTTYLSTTAIYNVTFTEIAPPPFRRPFVAQAGDGASEPLPKETNIAPCTSHSDISKGTTGEYFKSLRPIIKRFVHTLNLDTGTSLTLTPAQFANLDSSDPSTTQLVGTRAFVDFDKSIATPESWLNLVSYLFRFSAGSTRSKLFLNFTTQATSSLAITDTLMYQYGLPENDPAFVQLGLINNCVECTIPYYGQYRARTIGDELRGLGAAQTISTTPAGVFEYYEAAGDDYNFWFMIGPPVMRPAIVSPTSIPTVTPGVLVENYPLTHNTPISLL
jgi:hypothetical protein